MKKFEYISFNRIVRDPELNKLGADGWELITHTAVVSPYAAQQYYVFKREIISENSEDTSNQQDMKDVIATA